MLIFIFERARALRFRQQVLEMMNTLEEKGRIRKMALRAIETSKELKNSQTQI